MMTDPRSKGRGLTGHEKPNKGETDVWLTPPSIIERLGPFDLDPCGELHWPTAKTIYTARGLEQPWFGRVWLNPPYSEVGDWLERLADHGSGIALVFARTETKWAQKILPRATSVWFPAGRFKFHKPDGTVKGCAGAPSMFLAFGEKPDWKMPGWGVEQTPAIPNGQPTLSLE